MIRSMTHKNAGFTWIEMLIVVAVIAGLAMLAIPGLQEAAMRKQIKEGLALGAVATTGVQLAYTAKGEMPADNAAAGLPEATKIVGNQVKAVTVEQGAVTLTFGNNAAKSLHDKRLTLRPAIVPGEGRVPIAWVCAATPAPAGMELLGANKTDIEMSWLPVECRGSAK
jgi:type IV pilus assembly protein PilA